MLYLSDALLLMAEQCWVCLDFRALPSARRGRSPVTEASCGCCPFGCEPSGLATLSARHRTGNAEIEGMGDKLAPKMGFSMICRPNFACLNPISLRSGQDRKMGFLRGFARTAIIETVRGMGAIKGICAIKRGAVLVTGRSVHLTGPSAPLTDPPFPYRSWPDPTYSDLMGFFIP